MNTFLITGYPRSRTAWLSNLLTYGPSFCFHEPGLQCSSNSFPELFATVDCQYIGVAESRAVLYFDNWMRLFPDSRVVVVKRDPNDVTRSLARYGFNFRKVLDYYNDRLAVIEKHALVVPFNPLPSEAIWDHCVPGTPINKVRLQMLEPCQIMLTRQEMDKHKRI